MDVTSGPDPTRPANDVRGVDVDVAQIIQNPIMFLFWRHHGYYLKDGILEAASAGTTCGSRSGLESISASSAVAPQVAYTFGHCKSRGRPLQM